MALIDGKEESHMKRNLGRSWRMVCCASGRDDYGTMLSKSGKHNT